MNNSEFNSVVNKTNSLLTDNVSPKAISEAKKTLEELRYLYPKLSKRRQLVVNDIGRELNKRIANYQKPMIYQSHEEVEENDLKKFGFKEFRIGQIEAINSALNQKDSIVVMPTGGGKSLCYQIPAMKLMGLTIVVSPLIALIEDQFDKINNLGYPVAKLTSMMEASERNEVLDNLAEGYYKMIFVSPERFSSTKFINALKQNTINLFAVDEAHCISEWGHDFRPDYLRLPEIIKQLNYPCVMALTATATSIRIEEIIEKLNLEKPNRIIGSFNRTNLTFDVVPMNGKGAFTRKKELLLLLLSQEDKIPAIIYAGSRKDCQEIYQFLKDYDYKISVYHAGMDSQARQKSQEEFMNHKTDIMVATNAFGMGIDKSNIRTVIHYAVSSSLENYYQEAGRAGRDGNDSLALLLASKADLGRLISFNKQNVLSENQVYDFLFKLEDLADENNELFVDSIKTDNQRMSLIILEKAEIVEIVSQLQSKIKIKILKERISKTEKALVKKYVDISVDLGWQAYNSVKSYLENENTCRRETLLKHFNDKSNDQLKIRCCDVCDKIDYFSEQELEYLLGNNTLKPDTLKNIINNGNNISNKKIKTKSSINKPSVKTETITSLDDLLEFNNPKPKLPSKKTVNKNLDLSVIKKLDADILNKFSNDELVEYLKEWRKGRAGTLPAYTVCKNQTLEEIADLDNFNEIGLVRGIGDKFIENHLPSMIEYLNNL